MTRLCFAALLLALAPLPINAADRAPALLSDYPLPPPRANADSNIVPGAERAQPGGGAETPGSRNEADGGADAAVWEERTVSAVPSERPAGEAAAHEPTEVRAARMEARADEAGEEPAPPTPEAVDAYRLRLEEKLLNRYNSLPDFAGRVARVDVVLSKPLRLSLDGKFIRAEFDQMVYDVWGGRLPRLEREYYVITFGSGGAETVRSEPSVRVGLDMESVFSEHAPLAGDPFGKTAGNAPSAPAEAMPDWWRPSPVKTPGFPDHID